MRRCLIAVFAAAVLALTLVAPVGAAPPQDLDRKPVATGTGGAVSSVDPLATEAGLQVLRRGGNAIDAAVATAAVLGVTEPYSAGIGGGGFMVIHLADEGRVVTLDGREAAPMDPRFDRDVFIENGSPIPFNQRMTSGLAVGVPGTLATWVKALEDYGTLSLREALRYGKQIAANGFVVDATYASQTASNLARFRMFPATAETFLVDGEVPAVGSVVRNPDLANTYRYLERRGNAGLFEGPLAEAIVDTVQNPQTIASPPFPARPGFMTLDDLADYQVLEPPPTRVDYRGLDVYGMGPPSSGGLTTGESLNIMEVFDLPSSSAADRWHYLSEATALAYADRGAYIGDNRPGYEYVPITGLLSDAYAAERAALISPTSAMAKPVAPGNPCPHDGDPQCVSALVSAAAAGGATTHLTTADRWGNVVAYTLTIEATGGSGMTVPGWGFLLNNELTDFDATGNGPNLPAPGKRPRSSMAPTIVLDDGEPLLALGSPGGSTIITTVIAVLMNRIDGGMNLGDALAAPRSTQRNTAAVQGEAAWIAAYGPALQALGHTVTATGELGAATAIEILDGGRFLAAAEPVRRGGGAAGVVTEG